MTRIPTSATVKPMSGHTELPWSASGVRTRLDGQPMLQIIGPKGVVAYIPYSDLTPKDHLESHGDANLIVTACNSHADLVKALEEMIAEFGFSEKEYCGCSACSITKRARAALATLTARKAV